MGKLSIFARNELLDHIFNAAYTSVATVYVALSKAFSIRNGTYRWTASGSGTNEFYLELTAGGDPGLDGDPGHVIAENVVLAAGTVGSLSAGQWDFGDNDTLGFNTIYVRLADGADPDSKAADSVLAGGNPFDDAAGLNEHSGDGYAREAVTFGAASSRRVTQSGAVEFGTLSGDVGWVTHWAIMDALTTGNMLAHGALDVPKQLNNGNTPTIPTAEIYVEITGEFSNYAANNLLDRMFRNQAFAKPDTYVALTTVAVTESMTGSTITEPGSGAYARVQVNINGGASPTWDLAAAGALDNTHAITHPTATGSWGTIVGVAIVTASSAGEVLLFDNALADQAVGDKDVVTWPAGSLDCDLNS